MRTGNYVVTWLHGRWALALPVRVLLATLHGAFMDSDEFGVEVEAHSRTMLLQFNTMYHDIS